MAENAPETVYQQYKGFLTGNERAIASFIGIAIGSLRSLNDPDMASMMAHDELDFERLRKEKTALFINVPSQKSEVYGFLLSLLYTQLFESLMQRMPEDNDLTVYALMDEAGHTTIPHLDSVITTIRKFRVSISMVFQSLSQLEQRYGINGAKTIFQGGINACLVYGGLDVYTATLVERMMGKVQVEHLGHDGRINHQEFSLLNADRIRTLDQRQAILVYSNLDPIRLNTIPYFRNPRLVSATQRKAVAITEREDTPLAYLKL